MQFLLKTLTENLEQDSLSKYYQKCCNTVKTNGLYFAYFTKNTLRDKVDE